MSDAVLVVVKRMEEEKIWCEKVYNNYGGKEHVSLYYWLTAPHQHSVKKIRR
jgi:hypothetical protein